MEYGRPVYKRDGLTEVSYNSQKHRNTASIYLSCLSHALPFGVFRELSEKAV